MLKKVNKIRKSLSKSSVDKEEKKEKESAKKKSNHRVNQSSQTDDSTTSTKRNVSKKLNFKKVINRDKLKMDESDKSVNSLKVDDIPFMDSNSDEVQDKIEEEPFPKTVKILESDNGSKVYLIGTAHFSEESCKDVEYVINRVRPDVLVLEICKDRLTTMMLSEEILRKQIMDFFTLNQACEIIKTYGVLQGLIHIMLLYVTREATKQTGMLPGSEIIKAIKESEKIPHCVYNLADRPFYITFKRAIGSLTIYQTFKLALSILFSSSSMSKEEVEKYKQDDILECYLQELGKAYPKMKKALVDERDMYLAYNMQIACKSYFPLKNEFNNDAKHQSNYKYNLDGSQKIKSINSSSSSIRIDSVPHSSQIETYGIKSTNQQNHYNILRRRIVLDHENLKSFSELSNSNHGQNVVVGIVGMGHINGITRYFNKVSESEINSILEIPEPSFQSIVIRKAIKYSLYGIMVYTFYRFAIPSNIKTTIINLPLKYVDFSKKFINDKILVKN